MGGAVGGGGKGGSSIDFPATPDISQLAQDQLALSRGVARENLLLANPNSTGPFGTTTFELNPETGQGTITSRPLPGVEKLISDQVALRGQISDLAKQNFRASDSILRDSFDLSDIDEVVGIKGGLPDILTTFNDGRGLERVDVNRAAPDLIDAIDVTGLAEIPGLAAFRDLGQEAEDAVFNSFARRFDRINARAEERLLQDLANRGQPLGSENFNESLRQFRADTSDARLQAADRAVLTGEQVASQRFRDFLAGQGQDFGQRQAQAAFTNASRVAEAQNLLSALGFNNTAAINEATFSNAARSQAIREALTERNQALNEIGALSGQAAAFLPTPNNIGFRPVGFSTPDVFGGQLGLFNTLGNQAIAQAQVDAQNQASKLGGVADLGAAAITAFA